MGSERNFGFVFAGVFFLFGVWPAIFSDDKIRWWALGLGSIFVAAGLLTPSILKPLNRAWFKLGLFLGGIIAPVVMMLVFFVAVTPTALIARLMGKDFLRLKRTTAAGGSFWIDRKEDQKMGSMKNQF